MSKPTAMILSAIAVLAALVYPEPATADPLDLVNLSINVVWTEVSCTVFTTDPAASSGVCGAVPSTGPEMLVNFQFDPDTMSTAKPFVSCSYGPQPLNCSDIDEYGGLLFESASEEASGRGPDIYSFEFNIGSSEGGLFQISYYAGSWDVVPGSASGYFSVFHNYSYPGGTFGVTETWITPTPEPSSLLMLGTGLLAVGVLAGRPFAHS